MVEHEIQLGLGLEIAASDRTLLSPGEQASPPEQGWCTSNREFAKSLLQTQVALVTGILKAKTYPKQYSSTQDHTRAGQALFSLESQHTSWNQDALPTPLSTDVLPEPLLPTWHPAHS